MNLIDVYEMAEARDNRKKLQMEIINKHHIALISFTLNIPGPQKSSQLYTNIHNEGIRIISEVFSGLIKMDLIKDLKTGPEAYFAINLPVDQIKEKTIGIEEHHRLGRIFDIDVLDERGSSLTRSKLNYQRRKCLICNDEAANCSRSRKHRIEELLRKIESIYNCF